MHLVLRDLGLLHHEARVEAAGAADHAHDGAVIRLAGNAELTGVFRVERHDKTRRDIGPADVERFGDVGSAGNLKHRGAVQFLFQRLGIVF